MAAVSEPADTTITELAALTVATRDDMHALGRRLAALLGPGDLVVLTGDLGRARRRSPRASATASACAGR